MTPSLPDVILYARSGCSLCSETRTLLVALLDDRQARGLPAPRLVERDIETDDEWLRRYATTIPVVAVGDRELELAISPAKVRRLLADVLDGGAGDPT